SAMAISPHPPLWSLRSHRLKISVICMLAMYCMINMGASLGISMVCMVNSTGFEVNRMKESISMESPIVKGCSIEESDEKRRGYEGTLLWEPPMQSLLFSAVYYGGLLTIFISGSIADTFGPKKLLLGAILVISLITVLAPTLAQTNYWLFFVARIGQGMAEGFIVPSVNSLGSQWFAPAEKSSMAALYTSGVQISAATSPIIGSRLCGVNLMSGWPLIFYLFGSMGVLWLASCWFFVSDSPRESRWTSIEERQFLHNSLQTPTIKRATVIPWRSMFTSPAVYACVFANFTMYFCTAIVLNFLPLYFKEELNLSLKRNGMYSIAPFVGQIIAKNLFSILADRMKREKWMSNTATVKIFQSIGSLGTSLILIALATLPSCDRPSIAVALLFIYGILYAAGIPGFFTSMLVIAPAYTGTISSFSMVSAQLGSAIAPNIVSLISYL
ncbi:hypothetical protein PENTCL1PPCAC_17674, partial [Pristionchus entomophagus]